MTAFTTTITQLEPIHGKDRIELATVNGYQSIVAKGRYQIGNTVVYIPEQALLPDDLLEELDLTGRLAGAAKNRVKAMKMGGVLSQGIVCNPADWELAGRPEGDVGELLKITKWEPEIPIHMSGKIGRPRGNAPISPMFDIENIKKLRHVRVEYDDHGNVIEGSDYWFDPFNGDQVYVTEKLHGTNFAAHMATDGQIYVYSKGLGKQGHVLLESDENVYWRAFRKYPQIEAWLREWQGTDLMATVRGEVIGQGIQDLDYGVDFDVALFQREIVKPNGDLYIFASNIEGVPEVPVLYIGEYDYDHIVSLSLGKNIHGIPDRHVREGVVCRSLSRYTFLQGGGRACAKFINPDYLTRKGGTEFN